MARAGGCAGPRSYTTIRRAFVVVFDFLEIVPRR
jgi:hypothetical protein